MRKISNFLSRHYLKVLSAGVLMLSADMVNETTTLFYPQRLREAAKVDNIYTEEVMEIDSRLKGIETYLNQPVYSRLDAFNKPVLRHSAVDDSLTVQYSLGKQKDIIEFSRDVSGDIQELNAFNKYMKPLNITFLGLGAMGLVGGMIGALYHSGFLGQIQSEPRGGYHHGWNIQRISWNNSS